MVYYMFITERKFIDGFWQLHLQSTTARSGATGCHAQLRNPLDKQNLCEASFESFTSPLKTRDMSFTSLQ